MHSLDDNACHLPKQGREMRDQCTVNIAHNYTALWALNLLTDHSHFSSSLPVIIWLWWCDSSYGNVRPAILAQRKGPASCPQQKPAVTTWGKRLQEQDKIEQPFLFTPSHSSHQWFKYFLVKDYVPVSLFSMILPNSFLNLHLPVQSNECYTAARHLCNPAASSFCRQHVFSQLLHCYGWI